MTRALRTPSLFAFVLCVSCSSAPTDGFVDRLPVAAQCSTAAHADETRVGQAHVVSALGYCVDALGCAADKPMLRGARLEVELLLGALRSARSDAIAEDETTLTVSGFTLERDPCSNEPVARGELQFPSPGEAVLLVREDAKELDRLTFQVRDAAHVQLAAASDGEVFHGIDTGSITLDVASALDLRASALDAAGAQLITQGDGLYWLDDTASVALGAHGEPSASGALAQLTGIATGSTTLHVLVANVEQTFDVRVR